MPSGDLAVRVRAPSRLHFGLLSLGETAPRQFGGVGVMVERPETAVVVRMRPSGERVEAVHAAKKRARDFADLFRASVDSAVQRALIDRLEVRVERACPAHVGLGSGTQLAMSVARAIAVWIDRSDMPPDELARRVGRGARSSIGVHGFQLGGFIVDGGKREPTEISPVVARQHFPADWHFVLIIPKTAQGLHGAAERDAFDKLSAIPPAVTAELCRLTLLGILPAVAGRDFNAFSDSLLEFGRKVGECFAPIQGGVYASPLAATVVELLERHGVRGVAQSSWGPTLAAVADSRFRAEWLAARLADSLGTEQADFVCSPSNSFGAKVEIVETAMTR